MDETVQQHQQERDALKQTHEMTVAELRAEKARLEADAAEKLAAKEKQSADELAAAEKKFAESHADAHKAHAQEIERLEREVRAKEDAHKVCHRPVALLSSHYGLLAVRLTRARFT